MHRERFEQSGWDLSDAVPKAARSDFEGFVRTVDRKTTKLEGFRKRLPGIDRPGVEEALSTYEDLAEGLSRATSYSYMRYSSNTGDQKAKAELDAAEELDADVRSRSLFLRLWWTALPSARANSLVPSSQDFRYMLATWRKLRQFTLSEDVERAVNIKNTTGFLGWAHHYDRLTSRFTFRLRVEGKPLLDTAGRPKVLVVDELMRLTSSADPATRAAAYDALLRKYSEEGGVLGEVYRTVVRDWRNENVKLRGYGAPISPRNLENDVPDEAVKTLLEACVANAPTFQEFFRVKAKMLGMRRMDRRHIYAPFLQKGQHVSYDEAVRTVADAYASFDSGFGRLMLRAFELGHVDSVPREGKRSGAYCMSVTPGVVPYIFLNFAGTPRDVYTIAHESGHSIHSQLASSHSVLTFQPQLVLAETASVFGEMILFDRQMTKEKDDAVRKGVLLDKISSLYATTGRQANFVVFENEAHDAVDRGATVDELCARYYGNLRTQFGQAVDVPREFEWEWSMIPHIFHTPFYCYAYAFGNLLSLALYERYTEEGRSFVPDYARILSYGGSATPSVILDEFGLDIRSREFWNSGFEVIRRMVRMLRDI